MHSDQTKSLYLMQSQLIDTKVELSVSKAITQVVDQIISLRHEMHQEIHKMHHEIHGLRHEMIERFSGVESRLSSVETILGRREKFRGEIRTRFVDYAFNIAWLFGCSVLSATVASVIVLVGR